MSAFNRTTVASAVNALFVMGRAQEIESMRTVPYEFGIFAEQDIRALISMVYSLRIELVRLMHVSDKPLQDQPAEGSLDANDTGRPDEQAEEREQAIKDVSYGLAILERHLQSLDDQARKDLEEAGNRTQDGGRFRFNFQRPQYKSFVDSWEDWLSKQKADAEPNSVWLKKLELAEETVFIPFVSAQEATDEYRSYLDDNRLDASSERAWDRLIERAAMAGDELAKHQKAVDAYNALDAEGQKRESSYFAQQCREHKREMKSHDWWMDRLLEPAALLAHLGAPKVLLDSPEWRTKKAEQAAHNARLQAQEAQAQLAEVQALMLQQEANMQLMEARAQLARQQELMLVQQQAQQQRMIELGLIQAPVPSPASKKDKKSAKAKTEKAEKVETTKEAVPFKGATIHSTRGSYLGAYRRGA